jgi:hypothetical protein
VTLRSYQIKLLATEYIYIYIYNNTSELLTEIPQNRYLKYVCIIIHKIAVMPHMAYIIIQVKITRV